MGEESSIHNNALQQTCANLQVLLKKKIHRIVISQVLNHWEAAPAEPLPPSKL